MKLIIVLFAVIVLFLTACGPLPWQYTENDIKEAHNGYILYYCKTCKGKGIVVCEGCGGSGAVSCQSCNGQRFVYDDYGNVYNCTACAGQGAFVCPTCHGQQIESCNECSGDGFVFRKTK